MATRVEKQTVSGTDVVVGYGVINVATYVPGVGSTPGYTTYASQDVVVDVEIDYTAYLARIATAVETIATQTTTLASTLVEIEGHQQKLRELGEGNGIHIVGAYDAFGMVTLYRLLIEQAKILDNTGSAATPEQIAASIDEVERLVGLIRSNIPKEF